MQNSRVLKILGSFTKEEMMMCLGFVEVNYYKDKNPQELLVLFKLINNYFPDLEHPDLKKENAYRIVFTNIEWIPGKMDKLLTRLLKIVYKFISIEFKNENQNDQLTICQFLLNRNLKPIFDRELNKWSKTLESKHIDSSAVLYEHFLLKELIVENQSQNIHPKIKLELPDMLKSLDQYYIFTKLKYACQLLSINSFLLKVNTEDSLKSFNHLKLLMDLPHLQIPIIIIYYQAYKLLRSDFELASEQFNNFKETLDKYDQHISKNQLKALNALIRNFAIQKYMKGDNQYLENVFEIYKDHLNRGFLYHQEKILPLPMRNIVTFGLRLNQFDWVYQFITDHKDRITGSESPELFYNFNLALYYFHKKEYENALNILPQDFDDYYYKMGVKRLELIIYHDTDSPILESKVDAFKIFIYRTPDDKITKKHKEANNNFIHILKQIIHPKTEYDKSRKEKLKTKIQSTSIIAERDWLISILD